MIQTILTAVLAFLGTNIDDLVLLALLSASVKTKREEMHIAAGQCLGVAAITALSLVGAFLVRAVPTKYLHLFGLAPIIFGVAKGIQNWKGKAAQAQAEQPAIGVGTMTMLVLFGSGDNLSVYIPLFAVSGAVQVAVSSVVFMIMALVLCAAGKIIGQIPPIKQLVARWGEVLIPVVFITIGILILLG